MADVATLQARLTEAETVYHEWSLGQTVRTFRDQNGEQVEYSQAGMMRLASYLQWLRAQIAGASGPLSTYRGPMRFTFGRGGCL